MKKNNKGISLIVLSITILVMAILAATAIIALEDSGVIKRSKNTVKNNNYSDEYTRLVVIKNGILTDNLGTITIDEYVAELSNKGLIESAIITNADGSKSVTTKTGFNVKISQDGISNLNIVIDGYTPPSSNVGGNTGGDTTTPTPTITLNKTTISKTINSGSTATETITVTTANISGSLTWKSSNTSVATVSASGNTATITMKSAGTAVITATYGSTSASCTVVVTENTPATYEISGQWVFNETLNLPTTKITQKVTYTVDYEYYDIEINKLYLSFYNQEIYYSHNSGWEGDELRYIDFGTTPQSVSEEFYNWFTANATEQESLITFNISGKIFSAINGMTWENWVNSSYNLNGDYEIYENTYVTYLGGARVSHYGKNVLITDKIISGDTYTDGTEDCCFDPGTKVLMADGTIKNIEDVKVGDIVMSLNEETGKYIPQKVLKTIIKHNSDDLVYVNLSNGIRIGMRAYHPLLTIEGWKSLRPNNVQTIEELDKVELLKVGDTLIGYEENVRIVSIEIRNGEPNYDTYNLTIEGYHNYIANGVVVHNIITCVQ
ncbi:MAG: hypothetical protein IKL68_06400 [Clostridia bacterium]|nr:hypothetical protein [Clostridia bacterium]